MTVPQQKAAMLNIAIHKLKHFKGLSVYELADFFNEYIDVENAPTLARSRTVILELGFCFIDDEHAHDSSNKESHNENSIRIDTRMDIDTFKAILQAFEGYIGISAEG